MWNGNWNLKEGFAIGSGLVITGLLLQFTIGPVIWGAFAWPANIITLGILITLILLAYAVRKRVHLIRFGLSYASAVPAICFAVLLTLIMGLTRQSNAPSKDDPLGITSCLTWWPFILIYIWMAWIVGITAVHQLFLVIKRRSISRMQLSALTSHLGLFIVLSCGTLGSADMQRLKMYCEPGKPEWRGLDAANQVHELPVAVQLDSFIIEEYPPKLTLVENKTMKAVEVNGKPFTVLLDEDFHQAQMGGWTISVQEKIDDAAPRMTADTTTYVRWPVSGATCAVLVRAHKAGKQDLSGWVTCGSYRLPSQMLTLDNQYSIGMAQREPRRFASRVQLFSQNGDHVETIVEVNKPYTLLGWKIYQYSYNEQMGKWSNYSVFELVSDPWLPVVYTGIVLIMLGALCMFLGAGGKRKEVRHVG